MALVDLSTPLPYPGYLDSAITPTATTVTLDAAGEYVAHIFPAPKSGNIERIGYFTGTATGSPSVDLRVETVGADGMPTGTLWATNTNVTHSPASNTWYWLTLTAVAAVTRGQTVCVKIAYSSGTSIVVNRWGTAPISSRSLPYWILNTGTPTKSTGMNLNLAISYDDDSIPHIGTCPFSSTTITETRASDSTPDEIGILFQVPFACKAVGGVVRLSTIDETVALKLYDSGGSVLESVTGKDLDVMGSNGSMQILFDTEVELSADTDYRLTILAETNNAGGVTITRGVVDASATREAWPGGLLFQKTERTDAGSWTDTPTQVPIFSLLLSAIDDGAGTTPSTDATISGTCTLNATPVADAEIWAMNQDTMYVFGPSVSDGSGDYSIAVEDGYLYHVFASYFDDPDLYNALSAWNVEPVPD